MSYSVSDLWLSCNRWSANKAAALIGCCVGVYLWFSSAAIVAVTLSFEMGGNPQTLRLCTFVSLTSIT